MVSETITFYPVTSRSGNIVEAAFDDESETVLVRFNGGTLYEYGVGDEPVPRETWEQFKETFDDEDNSTGSFFHKTIKNFAFRKIG